MADPTAQVVIAATDRTQAAFRSADRGMKQLQRSANGMKTALASVGVVLSARAFAGWIKGALDAKNMTREQLEATKEARAAMDQMKKASDDLGRSLGIALAPAMKKVAEIAIGLSTVLFNADPSPLGKEIADLQDQIDSIRKHAIDTGIGELLYSPEQQALIAKLTADLQKLKTEQLDRLLDPNRFRKGDGLEEFDVDAIRGKETEVMRSMPTFDLNKPSEEMLRRAAEITASMKTELEKQVEQWRDAQEAFAHGLISADVVQRMQDSLLQPIKVTAQYMKDTNAERLANLMETFKTEGELELERYAQRLEDLQDLYDAEMVQREEFFALKEQLEQEHEARMTGIAQDEADRRLQVTQRTQTGTLGMIVSGMADATAALASGSKRMFDQHKKWAKAEATINAFRAIQQVWADQTMTWYEKVAATAVTAVSTAANISKINSTSFGGGASPSGGGVGGGVGGASAISNAPAAASQSSQIIRIEGTGERFTRAQVRELIEQINEAHKDGTRIVFATR